MAGYIIDEQGKKTLAHQTLPHKDGNRARHANGEPVNVRKKDQKLTGKVTKKVPAKKVNTDKEQ